MKFCRDAHTAQLPVNLGGTVRSIGILASVVKAHRAGLLVKLENVADLHVNSITLPGGGSAGLSVGGDIGGSVDNGPVDMAGYVIQLVNRFVCPGLGTCGKQQRKV